MGYPWNGWPVEAYRQGQDLSHMTGWRPVKRAFLAAQQWALPRSMRLVRLLTWLMRVLRLGGV
jgi:hypothetical protein